MRRLYFDLETDGGGDIKHGIDRHLETAKIGWMGWAINGGDVRVEHGITDDFSNDLISADLLVAHNATFDLRALELAGRWNPEARQLIADTMSMCHSMKIPASLDKAAEHLDLGAKLHVEFDPNSLFQPSESEWREYVTQDVHLCREIYRRLRPSISCDEMYAMDAHVRINVRGMPIDVGLLASAESTEGEALKHIDDMCRDICGYGLGQTVRIRDWFRERLGDPEFPTTSHRNVARLVDDESVPRDVRNVSRLIVQAAGNEYAKLSRMREATGKDGRLRDTLKFSGTVTGRWAGRGAHQHNAKRAGKARQCVRAPDGKYLFVIDFAQIEVRVGLWVAGLKSDLESLHTTDWYMQVAREVFGADAGKQERYWAKQGTIGVMYSAGVESMAKAMRVTVEDAAVIHGKLRKRFAAVSRRSNELYHAMQSVLRGGKGKRVDVDVGFGDGQKVTWRNHGKKLSMEIPTGRRIYYYDLRDDDGTLKYGLPQAQGGLLSHRGTIYEHVCSATSRDLLALALSVIEDSKLPCRVVSHIHDEIVLECENDSEELGEQIRRQMVLGAERIKGLLVDTEGAFSRVWEKPDSAPTKTVVSYNNQQ